ncbi:3006_t:CDS:2 [Cetraspora pellucida]|uniref:3006_t:CDS:1 n=1 Tax=Cetraspora pellucida TaxID=1433469 RepID=A0A9N9CVR8_9GLOM|nr:3006_t:CDS:2 [Cetraspora pellucida]
MSESTEVLETQPPFVATTDPQQEETAQNLEPDKLKTKQEWVKRMRLKFSIRPEFEITWNILHSDGTLNQDYFRPPKGSIPQLQRKLNEHKRRREHGDKRDFSKSH